VIAVADGAIEIAQHVRVLADRLDAGVEQARHQVCLSGHGILGLFHAPAS